MEWMTTLAGNKNKYQMKRKVRKKENMVFTLGEKSITKLHFFFPRTGHEWNAR